MRNLFPRTVSEVLTDWLPSRVSYRGVVNLTYDPNVPTATIEIGNDKIDLTNNLSKDLEGMGFNSWVEYFTDSGRGLPGLIIQFVKDQHMKIEINRVV